MPNGLQPVAGKGLKALTLSWESWRWLRCSLQRVSRGKTLLKCCFWDLPNGVFIGVTLRSPDIDGFRRGLSWGLCLSWGYGGSDWLRWRRRV